MLANRGEAIADRLAKHAEDNPSKRAVVCDDDCLTYGELLFGAHGCARRLAQLGCTPGGGERIGVLAHNSLDYAIVLAACQISGLPVVPLPTLITSDAQARMLEDANVTILFHDADHGEKARGAAAMLGGRRIELVEMRTPGAPSASNGLSAWVASDAATFDVPRIDDEWLSDLIYSSGTTGVPKGITQSFGSRKAQCISLGQLGVAADTGFLHTVSIYSNFGLSAFLLSLWWGGTFFMMRKFSGAAAVHLLAREEIHMAWFAPATLIRLMDAPGYEEAVRQRPCAKLTAGAPLSVAHKSKVLDTWPGPFFEIYGQTETGTLTLLSAHTSPREKLGSVGNVLPAVAVNIIDEAGAVLARGEEGEIVGHSATQMSGYHGNQDANSTAYWLDADGRSYVRTGDVGRLDADGYLWLCDRKKDMIISGGYNIYPADIERILSEHPAVFEAAVVGFASQSWGETPVGFVTLRSGSAVRAEELREWVNARVGSIQRVARIEIISELPNGALGKILKRELRDRFAGTVGLLP